MLVLVTARYYRYNWIDLLRSPGVNPHELFNNGLKHTSGWVGCHAWCHQMETFCVTGHLCGEFTGESPAQRPMTRGVDVFFDLRLNKQLIKQSWGWWDETPSRSLWHHCDGVGLFDLHLYCNDTWGSWHLKSPVTLETSKVRITGTLWGEWPVFRLLKRHAKNVSMSIRHPLLKLLFVIQYSKIFVAGELIVVDVMIVIYTVGN